MRPARSLHRVAHPSLSALALLAAAALLPRSVEAQPGARTYTAGRATLEVDGKTVPVSEMTGGVAVAEVVTQPAPDGFTKKRIGTVRYEPLEVEVPATDETMLAWIAASWKGNAQPKTVRAIDADFNYKATSVRELTGARIASTTVPTLDGTRRTPGYLTVALVSEGIRTQKGGGEDVRGGLGAKGKQWLTSNYRFELGGLPGNRVARIDSFTVMQEIAGGPVGERRSPGQRPGSLDFPNLHLTISMADQTPWAAWYEDFVVKGNNGDAQEKSGSITLLGPDMKEALATITLSNCGITRLGAEPATNPQVARFAVDLYCERMEMASP